MYEPTDFVFKLDDIYFVIAFVICWAIRSILVKFDKSPKDDTKAAPPTFFRAIYNIGFSLFGFAMVIVISSEFHALKAIYVTPWLVGFLKVGLFAAICGHLQAQAFNEGYRQASVHARERRLRPSDQE